MKNSNEAGFTASQNKKAWDELYASEDHVWGHDPMPFVEEFVAELKFTASHRILDAASGEGRNLQVLLKQPGEVYACDASVHAVEKLKKIDASFTCVHCDLAKTPFEDNFFDFILLVDTIETLPNLDDAMAELFRILKPKGRLLCNIPGMDDGISAVEMEHLGEKQFLYKGRYYYHFMSESEAIKQVQKHGFHVAKNEIRTWEEDAHPGFRDDHHEHTSRIFLLEKPEA